MKIIETPLPGVLIIEPQRFGDQRGFFLETYRQSLFGELGIGTFHQDNHSRSARGVLRGLHYQLHQPQGKLVRVACGAVFDVAVDVRGGSPTFGQWYGATLDDERMRMMYIPPGFAHGFVVLSERADFIYKCTDYYHPASEQGIAWNDPGIGIDWPLDDVTLSDKDRQNPRLDAQPAERLPLYTWDGA
ncbi:MAG: dTDP-4-dehydrorhamnose 3,5-epimerase [Candidatus Sedimenticola endophacoides]|uniref:dTDP-4-dehydrorhamnose 3,5-epimerase n=1 Tax=Candidatus Sedimenticola endophacoides TaxID=2548426 RepID=A0A6N4DMB4_9GAMM|nr:MAG: dTDP-4-dehydrorhamnose 3,5-epimerase [Candidatus Sedimenticola endophacoides]OQX36130.1 MAG: dTDP-4-dehydrorhamnose 3,5-epimerase [Candidatus Sedimenticola endophacoides]OQX42988.1 MAG: dTDP-4-dehydrorhamnose 3,5-epimerase [Candidatus Sedimenticola endophacoides]OQX47013.1 MAG: dTDP-4-dehydrorhamnose 3,5-epimerase [Candidatus Sedimenticola endophacoides]PUD98165.1 MAG: dTDP-4-dehydrorhamnose 3,5-epimerase [Candidatus Sedimenticola endophacoides]